MSNLKNIIGQYVLTNGIEAAEGSREEDARLDWEVQAIRHETVITCLSAF
jgi:hypothetical protein